MSNKKTEERAGRFAYDGLDRIMHEKARLGILTSLVTHPEGLVWNELKDLCALTDGNLSRHLTALEDAALVEVKKGFVARRPQTVVRLSAAGRKRFVAYLEELERVVADAAGARESVPARRKALDKGWSPA